MTGEIYSIHMGEDANFEKLKKILNEKEAIGSVIFFLNKEIVPENFIKPFSLIPSIKINGQCKAISILPYSYKQVVFCQSADGSWTESLLKFLNDTKTFESLLR